MRAGKLDAKITVQYSTSVVQPGGNRITTWHDFIDARAEVIQSGTEQFFRAYGAVDVAQTIFRVRHISGLLATHRIVYGGVNYRITKINEIRRKRGFEITTVTP
ncbi:UNVERIFIED_ORG: SPP1 family predicted phage head-tail adaptor [Agrobacterium larrymoorei]|nr:SPP1 family predicted phage head-tail adaptor [Agrobacterium larrymoorei]